MFLKKRWFIIASILTLFILIICNKNTIEHKVHLICTNFLLEPNGVFKFILLASLLSSFFIPISWFKALGALYLGATYGFIYGILIAIISSTFSFFIGKLFGRNKIIKILEKTFKKESFNKIEEIIEDKNKISFFNIFLLRNMYVVPFSLTNYTLSISNVSFKRYFIATFIGIIPGTFFYTYFFAKSINILNSPKEIILPSIILISYYIVTYILKNKINQVTSAT